MKKLLTILALSLSLTACSDAPKAERALIGAGYTEIQIKGMSWTSCSDSDSMSNNFIAKGLNGQTVTGTVCMGWFKGSTIRLD